MIEIVAGDHVPDLPFVIVDRQGGHGRSHRELWDGNGVATVVPWQAQRPRRSSEGLAYARELTRHHVARDNARIKRPNRRPVKFNGPTCRRSLRKSPGVL